MSKSISLADKTYDIVPLQVPVIRDQMFADLEVGTIIYYLWLKLVEEGLSIQQTSLYFKGKLRLSRVSVIEYRGNANHVMVIAPAIEGDKALVFTIESLPTLKGIYHDEEK